MAKDKAVKKSFSEITREGLVVVRKKLIEKEKKNNGYIVVGDANGKVTKIPAKDL